MRQQLFVLVSAEDLRRLRRGEPWDLTVLGQGVTFQYERAKVRPATATAAADRPVKGPYKVSKGRFACPTCARVFKSGQARGGHARHCTGRTTTSA